ncbi:MAG: MerR family transcriptional regulator [Cyanobacteria bacterium P01_H01_bin.121]
MKTLQQLAQASSQWDLATFVKIANDLLPQFSMPTTAETGTTRRSPESINPRLVRYYTSTGVLDRPLKHGKEARYIYRHLLQLLVVRRLLGDGYSINTIQPVTTAKTDADLEALLQGGVQLTVEARNPALAFLQSVQARTDPQAAAAQQPSATAALAQSSPAQAQSTHRSKATPKQAANSRQGRAAAVGATDSEQQLRPNDVLPNGSDSLQTASDLSGWQHLMVLPGLEIQIRDNFAKPATPQEYDNLLRLISHKLKPLLTARSSPV